MISKSQAMFFRFCDIAIIIECTSTHTYMHTHTYSPNIPSMKYQIMKHCYTNKSDDPRGKLCAIRACLCPDNCGEHGLLREFSSWSQGPSDLRRLRCSLDFDWESVPSDGLENLKLHLQSTLAASFFFFFFLIDLIGV